MKQKLLKAKKSKIISKKDVVEEANVVLVGTYKDKQLAWIKKHGVYNYPIKDEDELKPESCAKVKELWLYASAKGKRYCFAAEFVGIQSKDEFLAANPTYKNLGQSKHARYMVFKTSVLDYGPRLDGATVFARVSDFEKGRGRTKKIAAAIKQFHADGDFGLLADYLPSDLAKLPRERLRVCEAMGQLDFLYTLDDADKIVAKFKHRIEGDTTLRFVDLFAGIGGVRKGFELACADKGIKTQCVFTSEIKPHAIEVLKQNHPDEYIHGDITQVNKNDIPDFDVLLGGFPCQAFSAAGKRLGFEDTHGTLFFDVARILKAKNPLGFVLENVEGLVNHEMEAA